MRSLRTACIVALVAGVACLMPAFLSAQEILLMGKVGEFGVAASLERNEGELSGWYFYFSRAVQIRLNGTVGQGGGNFVMEESVGGKKTGVFEGTVKEGRWSGTWRKPDGGTPLPFELNENLVPTGDVNMHCATQERDAKFGYTYSRSLETVVSSGVVKKFRAEQRATGSGRDEQACSIDLGDLMQVLSNSSILLQAKDYGGAVEGGGNCRVRILGDGDGLWFRFGDPAEEGNDCRSAGATMFCSPRAFWNDVLVNRRTGKCTPLK